MTGKSAHDRHVGEGPASDAPALGTPRWRALRQSTSAMAEQVRDTAGREGVVRGAPALDAPAPGAAAPRVPTPGALTAGAPTPIGSAPIPGPAVVAGARPADVSGVRHPSRRGPRRRWRALRLGVGWAMLVAIGGVAMLPAADALASGVDRPPYIVQQVVASSPTATSQGEGTRRD